MLVENRSLSFGDWLDIKSNLDNVNENLKETLLKKSNYSFEELIRLHIELYEKQIDLLKWIAKVRGIDIDE